MGAFVILQQVWTPWGQVAWVWRDTKRCRLKEQRVSWFMRFRSHIPESLFRIRVSEQTNPRKDICLGITHL